MSSFAYMKVLESSPERYDRGIQILSRGRIGEVYKLIAETVAEMGKTVLDIGCGTGNVSIACARRGASVVGIDINSGMLEVAQRKADEAGLRERIEFMELGIGELKGEFKPRTFDACVSCLSFSEMSADEQSYAISVSYSILKPNGILMIADESVPMRIGGRLLHSLVQLPIKLIAYLLTQSSTKPLRDLMPVLGTRNFHDLKVTHIWGESFIIITAKKGGQA